MIDIEHLQNEIVERLKPLNPEKIILFGSYAYGEPDEESDIDLFVVKDVTEKEVRSTMIKAKKMLRDLVFREKIGVDIFVDSSSRIKYRIEDVKDQFYRQILEQGKVLYG